MLHDLSAALALVKARYAARNPRSEAQHVAACRAMPGGNTRSVLFHDPFPLAIDRAESAYIWDCDGHRYIDFLGDFTSGLYGHSDPHIVGAIRAALAKGLSLSGQTVLEAQLAALITSRFPGIDLVRFTNSGTEANLMALAAARIRTNRPKVLVFAGGYHGSLLSFAGPMEMNLPLDLVSGTFNDLDATRGLVAEFAGSLSAILVEPMQGAAGCIPATPEFLTMLRDAATETGAVLVFDEVMTSRLSWGGRQLQLGIIPDITTLGKYLAGGMSFGAFGGRAQIMEMFDPRRPEHLVHSGTFNNNILSMAAGVAGLSRVLTADALAQLNRRGDRLRERLNAVGQSSRVGLQFTGLGSIFTAHPTKRPVCSIADLADIDPSERELFYYYLLEHGIYIAKRGFFSLMLPVTDEHCEQLIEVVTGYVRWRASIRET